MANLYIYPKGGEPSTYPLSSRRHCQPKPVFQVDNDLLPVVPETPEVVHETDSAGD